MVLTTIFLPGVLIYFVYSLLGIGLRSNYESNDDTLFKISVWQGENIVNMFSSALPMDVEVVDDENQIDVAKNGL